MFPSALNAPLLGETLQTMYTSCFFFFFIGFNIELELFLTCKQLLFFHSNEKGKTESMIFPAIYELY